MKSQLSKQLLQCLVLLALPGFGLSAAGYQDVLQTENYEASQGYDCLIEAHAIVDVSTRDLGVVDEVAVSRGDIVKKGQLLVKLDSGTEQLTADLANARAEMTAKVESKQASLGFSKRVQERVNGLYVKKAAPFHEKDKADTDVMLAKIDLLDEQEALQLAIIEAKRAEDYLQRRSIYSPVDGVVVKLLLYPGESVKDKSIVTIAQIHPLNVEVILPVKLYGQIKVGDDANIKLLMPDGGVMKATVVIVDRVIDAASNTFGVRLELPNPEYLIPSGLQCEISLPDSH